MALLEIKKFGCPTLKKTCSVVGVVTDDMRRLIDDMYETMYEAEGIGLAAPQVGVTERLLVLDVRPLDPGATPQVFINPEILWSAGEWVGEEGCLSLPGVAGDVKRPAQVHVRALDQDGKPFEVRLEGIGAKALQHEVDHLDGILVLDRFSTIKRNIIRGQLRKLQRTGKQQALGLTYVVPGENKVQNTE